MAIVQSAKRIRVICGKYSDSPLAAGGIPFILQQHMMLSISRFCS
jgi:hypothetical protein